MGKRQREKVRQRLDAKLAELTGKSAQRNELITERSNDPMDEIQSRQDLDLAVRAIDTNWKTKKAVETAIKLLETGEYGICQECGEPINPKRLQAIPWTTLCVSCQEAYDAEPDGKPSDRRYKRAA